MEARNAVPAPVLEEVPGPAAQPAGAAEQPAGAAPQPAAAAPQPAGAQRPRPNTRCRAWVFTLNNPTMPKEQTLALFPQAVSVIVGDEVGENGTPHQQGYVRFRNAVAFNTVRALLPAAHLEPARGDPASNYQYCSKENQFVSRGPFNRRGGTSAAENLDVVAALIANEYAAVRFEAIYIRHKHKIDELVRQERSRRFRCRKYEELVSMVLRGWQVRLTMSLFAQNHREITWFSEAQGGAGKSTLARYLAYVYGYVLLDGVSSARDIAILLGNSPRGVIFDVSRDDMKNFCYNTLEAVKNGRVCTGKYQGFINEFDIVPVLVLANQLPDRTKLSEDRWHVISYDDGEDDLDPEGTQRLTEAHVPRNFWAPPEDLAPAPAAPAAPGPPAAPAPAAAPEVLPAPDAAPIDE